MSILRPYLKSNEVAVDCDVLDEWMHKLHRVGLTLSEPQDALSIRNDIYTILNQTRWTDKQSLTVEGDAALDELARHEATIAVPVATLEDWRETLLTIEITSNPRWEDLHDKIRELVDVMDALLSTSAEKGPGGE